VLRADPACAFLFDALVVCGGETPELFCTGFETSVIVGCERERSDFVSCLAASDGDPIDCVAEDPSCIALCNGLAEPQCATTMPVDTCACWCQDELGVDCRDRVQLLVACTGGGPTFTCDDRGIPTLAGPACAADWTELEASCF